MLKNLSNKERKMRDAGYSPVHPFRTLMDLEIGKEKGFFVVSS
jgi:hypothetical protein